MYTDPRDARFTAPILPSNHPQQVIERQAADNAKLRAERDTAVRELSLYKRVIRETKEQSTEDLQFVFDGITNRVAELLREEKMNEWQPIETAPKDGGYILGAHYSKQWGQLHYSIREMRWSVKHKMWKNQDCEYDVGYNPTHWMPLPEPPK